jgi:hypothetical protein
MCEETQNFFKIIIRFSIFLEGSRCIEHGKIFFLQFDLVRDYKICNVAGKC